MGRTRLTRNSLNLPKEPSLKEAVEILLDVVRHYEEGTIPEAPEAAEIIRVGQAFQVVRTGLNDMQQYYDLQMSIKLEWYKEQLNIWNAYNHLADE